MKIEQDWKNDSCSSQSPDYKYEDLSLNLESELAERLSSVSNGMYGKITLWPKRLLFA